MSIEAVNIRKTYGQFQALKDVSIRIESGELVALLGPSGCGKTSTLRLVAGHETASSGDIIIGSKNVTELPPAARGTAMMFQSYALFPHLTTVDNVAF